MDDKVQFGGFNNVPPVPEIGNEHTIYTDEFLSILLDEQNQWLYVNWTGYQTEGSIKKGCEELLNALIKYQVKKVLNDNSNVLGIWTPAAEWLGNKWLPRMQAAGLSHFAWVYSPSRLSQVSTNVAIEHAPLPQLIKTFYQVAEAKDWLKSSA